ncbi:MAG: hypothetical protein OXU98_10520 [Gammaproteobacteria bacterium]|nr:hypothetical protein [Gammaproteobacteria bacterium]
MTDRKKYGCPHCDAAEYVTKPNAYDVYVAEKDELRLENRALTGDELKLFCRKCGKRAPRRFENAATA